MKLNEIKFVKPLPQFVYSREQDEKETFEYWEHDDRWVYWLQNLIRATNSHHSYSTSNCYTMKRTDFWSITVHLPRYTIRSANYEVAFSEKQVINSILKNKGSINRSTIEKFEIACNRLKIRTSSKKH